MRGRGDRDRIDHSVGLGQGTDRRIPERGGPWGCRWCPACGNGEEGGRVVGNPLSVEICGQGSDAASQNGRN